MYKMPTLSPNVPIYPGLAHRGARMLQDGSQLGGKTHGQTGFFQFFFKESEVNLTIQSNYLPL